MGNRHAEEQAIVTTEPAPLQSLAAQINVAHDEALASVRTALEHACRAGDLLLEAKRQLGHGAWLPWLGQHCCTDVSERTAQKYMQLARDLPKLTANTPRAADLSLPGALALLSERAESHVEDAEDGRLNLNERDDWTAEFRAWVELIEGVRKTVTEVDQHFNAYDNSDDVSDAEAREFMRVVMTSLLNIEANVARIRNRPTPTRTEDVVVDDMGIQKKCLELDSALGDVLSEALEPSEELRRLRASNRLIEQANALMGGAKDMADEARVVV